MHTYIHVSALVRGLVGPEAFDTPEWEPPAATAAERALVARLAAYDSEHRGLTNALLPHGSPPQGKGHLQRALAREGAETGFTVKTASFVTGFVKHDGVCATFDEPHRTPIIDLDAVTDDDGAIREPQIGAVYALAHEVGAYRTVIRVAEGWQVPDAWLLTEVLPAGQCADIAVMWDGHDSVDDLARSSHYRRSKATPLPRSAARTRSSGRGSISVRGCPRRRPRSSRCALLGRTQCVVDYANTRPSDAFGERGIYRANLPNSVRLLVHY